MISGSGNLIKKVIMKSKGSAAAAVSTTINYPSAFNKNLLINLQTIVQMEDLRKRNGDKLLIILFWASWFRECEIIRKLF